MDRPGDTLIKGFRVLLGAEDGAARNLTLGARAAVYRGAAVLSQRRTGGLRRRRGENFFQEFEKKWRPTRLLKSF